MHTIGGWYSATLWCIYCGRQPTYNCMNNVTDQLGIQLISHKYEPEMSSDAGPHLPLALHQIAINILVRWPILHIIQHKHNRHTNIMTQTLVGRWYCCLTWLEFLVLIQPQWFSLLPPRHFIAAIYICIQTYGWFYHFWSLWYNYGCIADIIIILVNIIIVSLTATVNQCLISISTEAACTIFN